MHFEISRAFKPGKQLNAAQRAHSHFAEEPVVGGYRLSAMAPVLKVDLAKFKVLWPQSKRLMAAHAINIHGVDDGGRKHDLREFLEQIRKDLANGRTFEGDPVLEALAHFERKSPEDLEEMHKDMHPEDIQDPVFVPPTEDSVTIVVKTEEAPVLPPVVEVAPVVVQPEETPATVAAPTASPEAPKAPKAKKNK